MKKHILGSMSISLFNAFNGPQARGEVRRRPLGLEFELPKTPTGRIIRIFSTSNVFRRVSVNNGTFRWSCRRPFKRFSNYKNFIGTSAKRFEIKIYNLFSITRLPKRCYHCLIMYLRQFQNLSAAKFKNTPASKMIYLFSLLTSAEMV